MIAQLKNNWLIIIFYSGVIFAAEQVPLPPFRFTIESEKIDDSMIKIFLKLEQNRPHNYNVLSDNEIKIQYPMHYTKAEVTYFFRFEKPFSSRVDTIPKVVLTQSFLNFKYGESPVTYVLLSSFSELSEAVRNTPLAYTKTGGITQLSHKLSNRNFNARQLLDFVVFKNIEPLFSDTIKNHKTKKVFENRADVETIDLEQQEQQYQIWYCQCYDWLVYLERFSIDLQKYSITQAEAEKLISEPYDNTISNTLVPKVTVSQQHIHIPLDSQFKFVINSQKINNDTIKIYLKLHQHDKSHIYYYTQSMIRTISEIAMDFNDMIITCYLKFEKALDIEDELPDIDFKRSLFSFRIDDNLPSKYVLLDKLISAYDSLIGQRIRPQIEEHDKFEALKKQTEQILLELSLLASVKFEQLIKKTMQEKIVEETFLERTVFEPTTISQDNSWYLSCYDFIVYVFFLRDTFSRRNCLISAEEAKQLLSQKQIPSHASVFSWLNTAWLQSKFQQYVAPYRREIIAGLGFLTAGALLLLARYTESGALSIPSWTKSFFLPKSLPPGYRPGVNVKPVEPSIFAPDFPARTFVDVKLGIERTSSSASSQ